MNQNIHQCSQCKNNFPKQEVYRIGIKQKDFFCRECAKNIKSECMWCGKELKQKKWKRIGGYEIKSEEGSLAETIDHENRRGERHHKYYLTCEETKEHGMRPNQSCPSRVNDWLVEKGKQRRQEKSSKGWKECQGKAVYFKNPKTGKVIFDMKCWKLLPPGENYCKDESCVYYTAMYNDIHSEERKRIKQKWNQRTQEKYQRANEWWNSLTLEEKQTELKKEEEHLNNLGLQRQRCWIENIDKNSILFENGKLHYDNIDKIPPSFLDRFGLPGFRWESVWKNDSNRTNTLQTKVAIDKEVSKKEHLLKKAKENGESELAIQLERQLQELKSQVKTPLSVENPNKTVNYLLVGLVSFSLIGLVLIIAKSKRKNPKTKL